MAEKKKKKKKKKKNKKKADLVKENKDLKERAEKAEELQSSLLKCITSEIRREMLKTSLLALGIALCAIVWLWLGCFHEAPSPLLNCVSGSVIIFLVGVLLISIAKSKGLDDLITAGVFTSIIVGTLAGSSNSIFLWQPLHYGLFILLSMLTISVIVFAGYNRESKSFNAYPSMIIFLIFAAITLLGVKPLSKHHNTNQLRRDERLAEILEINPVESGIEVILPPEHVSEQRYLKNVFFVKSEIKKIDKSSWDWERDSIFCKEGEKEWYKVILPPQSGGIIFFFNHPWQDYEIKKEIPVP